VKNISKNKISKRASDLPEHAARRVSGRANQAALHPDIVKNISKIKYLKEPPTSPSTPPGGSRGALTRQRYTPTIGIFFRKGQYCNLIYIISKF